MVKKTYSEAEMVRTFNLTRLTTVITPRMADWLAVEDPVFTPFEQYTFDKILSDAMRNMVGWNEEKLKMKFISPLLEISHIDDTDKYVTFYEKRLEDVVEGKPLSVKTDFMIATGLLDLYEKPFFHFQEYKPSLNPSGDPMGQLLQAMLIAQVQNKDNKPIYGAIIVGQNWNFVIIQGKEYCISPMYDAISKKGLLQIISILRKFKHILETELIVD
jgi:hypothetical protein